MDEIINMEEMQVNVAKNIGYNGQIVEQRKQGVRLMFASNIYQLDNYS